MRITKSSKIIGIGILGLGTVASGVVGLLRRQAAAIEKKTGIRLVLKKVCVKSLTKKRAVKIPRRLLTTHVQDLLKDRSIDIFVELVGGIQPAKKIIAQAFQNGKHVVTANKALLAEKGNFIFGLSRKHSKKLGIEASVCGGIPIIKAIKEGLASNTISHFLGIVNGTCNFILTRMSDQAIGFEEALRQAQQKGYAEKNPTLDIRGIDSAHKLAILARMAFGAEVRFASIPAEGIESLATADIEYAKELGYSIKLLAIGKRHEKGLELRVHPTMLPLDHPLSNVRGVYNAVFLHADQAGDLLFYGKGAGKFPTASAVMSDIIDIAKRISGEVDLKAPVASVPGRLKIYPIENMRSKYYLRFQVADRPGVLGRIAQALGKNHISILSVHQKESHDPGSVPVIILTYEAQEKDLRRALKTIDSGNFVSRKTVVIRVEK